jgi:hypothetical protein
VLQGPSRLIEPNKHESPLLHAASHPSATAAMANSSCRTPQPHAAKSFPYRPRSHSMAEGLPAASPQARRSRSRGFELASLGSICSGWPTTTCFSLSWTSLSHRPMEESRAICCSLRPDLLLSRLLPVMRASSTVMVQICTNVLQWSSEMHKHNAG